jgi:hypothetical protein
MGLIDSPEENQFIGTTKNIIINENAKHAIHRQMTITMLLCM